MPCDEYRSSPTLGSAVITGNTFPPRSVEFAIIANRAIFEGDIDLGPVSRVTSNASGDSRDSQFSTFGLGILGSGFRWPRGVIPFRIDAALPNPARVTQAIQHWEASTFIRFIQRTTENNFVTFQQGTGCSSSVGMIGSEQFITLDTNCDRGNTIHEIGHAVGLWHEQSRADRDSFVTIDLSNIAIGDRHNFAQHITDGEDIGTYDYGSIMHYGAFAFAINPANPTIISPQPIGQRTGLSAGDVRAVEFLYFPQPVEDLPMSIKQIEHAGIIANGGTAYLRLPQCMQAIVYAHFFTGNGNVNTSYILHVTFRQDVPGSHNAGVEVVSTNPDPDIHSPSHPGFNPNAPVVNQWSLRTDGLGLVLSATPVTPTGNQVEYRLNALLQ